MKSMLTLLALLGLTGISCEKNNKPESGKGFELYLTVKSYMDHLDYDYSTVNFDTIALETNPFLRYHDIISYDTLTHKLKLRISHDSLKIGDAGAYGRMFVATLDKEPVYCGFKWPVYSSVPCNWVYIEEPYQALDHLNPNEIVIRFSSDPSKDPRPNYQIVTRLKADGKIKP